MSKKTNFQIEVALPRNSRSTDEHQIKRRHTRTHRQGFRIANLNPPNPVFSNARKTLNESGRRKAGPHAAGAPLPTDRPRSFAAAAHQKINGALLRCEERYPNTGSHSVLYVVVDGEAPQLREKLTALHKEYFGPGQCDPLAPVRLEVIDRATDEAIQRLMDARLLVRTTRGIRPLWPADAFDAKSAPLSSVELEKINAHRQRAARKLKIARVLAGAGLGEEARSALLEGMFPLSCALAAEQRLPEPASVTDALLPPFSPLWNYALPVVREFVCNNARPCLPVLEALNSL
jgi:hypothetical protein